MIKTIKPMDFNGTTQTYYSEENLNLTITCKVESDPKPTNIIWFKDNKRLHVNNRLKVNQSNPEKLVILQASTKDSGKYKCQAQQITPSTSKAKSILLQVKILHKPYWVNTNKTIIYKTIQPQEQVNLTCIVEAFPPPIITWHANDQYFETINTSDTKNLRETEIESSLYLIASNKPLTKNYTCRAENHLGNIERKFVLSPKNLKTTENGTNSKFNPKLYGHIAVVTSLALIILLIV